eukprot:TRINITY_DN7747_c0_g1_i2.p1 TRINITY_DN7747_c0_g1~~TRINITY_DN7747_c0_g1_i2.p1  ORF type:complete len:324 (-),score=71.67 TRINITY_DN7747_c0_g1_i2:22-993(-)
MHLRRRNFNQNQDDSVYEKPEYALKRAEELIKLEKEAEALETLYKLFANKRHKTWSKDMDKAIKKFLELCVNRNQGKKAKDALHQFRNMTQQQQNSLEEVLEFFMQKAEDAVEKAQKQAETAHAQANKEEQEPSKESSLLTSIAGEDSKDRLDKELVTPWLKFLWETYRMVLDILRNNPKLEHVYRATATRSFNFCLKYRRIAEFRRICEVLRSHLATASKGKAQPTYNAENPDDLRQLLKIRFAQLATASGLELWQEAYRSVEDINGIMNNTKESPPDEMMAEYYKSLSQIFWVSHNYVFHASALYRYYELHTVLQLSLIHI